MPKAEFRFSGQFIKSILQTGAVSPASRVSDGLPPDAKVVGCQYDAWTDTVRILIESDSFVEAKEGELPPMRNITVERLS